MKKAVFATVLVCMIALLGNVIAISPAACGSSDPAHLVLEGYKVGGGTFLIELTNNTDSEIDVRSFDSSIFVIEKSSKGIIKQGEKIQIEGSYPKDKTDFLEQISMTYTDHLGNEKEATFQCQIGLNPQYIIAIQTLTSLISLSALFFIVGISLIAAGHFKKKKKLKKLGLILIIVAAVSIFLLAICFFSF